MKGRLVPVRLPRHSAGKVTCLTVLVAAIVLTAGAAMAAVSLPFSDDFNRSSGGLGSPWTSTDGWSIDSGKVKLNASGFREVVVDTGRSDNYRVSVDVTLSPNRASVGLTTLWEGHNNHIFCKVEVTPGNPTGLMSIGHRLNGNIVSLLKLARGFGLRTGQSYQLVVTKQDRVITFTVSGSSISGGSKSLSHTLTDAEFAEFGFATRSGLRSKNLADEDDGRSRYDNFRVEAL